MPFSGQAKFAALFARMAVMERSGTSENSSTLTESDQIFEIQGRRRPRPLLLRYRQAADLDARIQKKGDKTPKARSKRAELFKQEFITRMGQR